MRVRGFGKDLGISLAVYAVTKVAQKGAEKIFDKYDIHTIKKNQERAKEAKEDYVVVQDGKEFCVIL